MQMKIKMPDPRNPGSLVMNREEKSSTKEDLKFRAHTLRKGKVITLKTGEEFSQTLQPPSINTIITRRTRMT